MEALAVADDHLIKLPNFRWHLASNGILLAKPEDKDEVNVYLPYYVVKKGSPALNGAIVTSSDIDDAIQESGIFA